MILSDVEMAVDAQFNEMLKGMDHFKIDYAFLDHTKNFLNDRCQSLEDVESIKEAILAL